MERIKSISGGVGAKRRKTHGPERCWQWFTRFFPRGFHDPKYLDWERSYKWNAHEQWEESLSARKFTSLLKQRRFGEIAATAIRIESRTNLLFSFEFRY